MASNLSGFSLEWADLNLEPRDGVVDGPTWDDVESIVRRLAECDEGFVIFARDAQTYVQAAVRMPGQPEAGLVVEYQVGSTARHFNLEREFIDAAVAVEVFRAFAANPAVQPGPGPWVLMDL